MIVVRILRDGLTVREQVFHATPVSIGRAAGCDVVLTDASVSRDHAQIERGPDGALVIVDGAGTNGLYAGPRRVSAEPVVGRLRARLGLAEIEIEEVSSDATQPITLEDLHGLDQRRTPLTWAKYIAVAILALNLETVLMPDFWSPWNSQRFVAVVWQSASLLVAMLVLSSILLGLLKAAGRKVRMADVLRHFAVFAWLRPLAAVVSLLAYYALPDGPASTFRAMLPLLASVAFFAQAAAIRRRPPNRAFRWAWAMALLLVMAGVGFTGSYSARRGGQPEVDYNLQIPLPGGTTGPAVEFSEYAAELEAAGNRSADPAR